MSLSLVQAQARRRRHSLCRFNSSPSFLLFLLSVLVVLLSLSITVEAQSRGFLNNGRFFTAALAISNSPQPGSPVHAGSNLVISIELSGDGRIPQSAFSPGSGLPTRYDSLEIYLVSASLNTNLTVSSGPGLLTQEPGSTVKHLNWPVPRCIPPGEYNLTYYEASTINDQSFYSITPLPVTVNNPNPPPNAACPSSNPVQQQPQADSAPSVHPFLDANRALQTSRPIPSQNVPQFIPPPAPTPTDRIVTVTQGPFFSRPQSTATIVVVATETFVGTADDLVFTTTGLVTNTVTAVVDVNVVATGVLFPVNAASHSILMPKTFVLLTPFFATLITFLSL